MCLLTRPANQRARRLSAPAQLSDDRPATIKGGCSCTWTLNPLLAQATRPSICELWCSSSRPITDIAVGSYCYSIVHFSFSDTIASVIGELHGNKKITSTLIKRKANKKKCANKRTRKVNKTFTGEFF